MAYRRMKCRDDGGSQLARSGAGRTLQPPDLTYVARNSPLCAASHGQTRQFLQHPLKVGAIQVAHVTHPDDPLGNLPQTPG